MDMSTFGKYTLRLKHDKGFVNISTVAMSEQAAKNTILAAERAPERAIRKITFKPIAIN
jgi:hypothetical protein